MKNTKILLLCCIAILTLQCVSNKANTTSQATTAAIQNLKNWLAKPAEERGALESTTFAKEELTKTQAEEAIKLLYSDKKALMLEKYGKEWDKRELSYQDYKMRFFYDKFGKKPADGRSLYISLHGGGGAPASVNDQQYNNQKHLYDATMKNMEGIYLAPRAPTNTWNLWHESHIDELMNLLIQMAVIKENVNPNKVYLLGYSAGGDGVYQLAPRMADRWAAASMMAGHPNDALPFNLRNTPFTIHMGAEDAAYNRNKVAQKWKDALQELQSQTSKSAYVHEVQIHEGLGHWMKLEDKVALPWMAKFQRNPIPEKIAWKQSGRHHASFYWVKTPKEMIETKGEIKVAYNRAVNEIIINENYGEIIELLINDKMLDLDNVITIKYKDKVLHKGKLTRSILNIQESLAGKGDLNLAFSAKVSIKNNEIIQ